MSEPLGVCAIVKNDLNQILLGKRKGGYKAGTWGLPGGRIEGNESLEKALSRELLEETGLLAQRLKYIGVVREFQDVDSFVHFIYACPDYAGEPTNREPEKCEGWEWISLDKLPEPILRGHAAAIDMYIKQDSQIRDLVI